MAALLTITLLLLCYSITASEDKCDYNVATGEDFTVPLETMLTQHQKIEWMHKDSKFFYGTMKDGKIFVVTGNEMNISPNGSLKLTKVDKTKAGTYTPKIYTTEGQGIILHKKSLCVLDRVTKPSVKIICGRQPKDSQVTFTCNFNNQEGQIEWLKNKEVIKNEKATTLKQDAEKVESDSFSCKVSNAVSFMVSEPVTQTCFRSKFRFFYDDVMGVQIWIIIASGGGVVLLLIVTIIVCCIMNKRKKRMNLMDEEELRLDWTNTEQQHHHHHPHNHNHKHHHHNPPPDHHQQQQQQQQQQPAGHTGPRQSRSRQQREQRPRLPEPPGSHPQPSPRRAAQGPGPAGNHDDEQPPPLPQPRKKAAM